MSTEIEKKLVGISDALTALSDSVESKVKTAAEKMLIEEKIHSDKKVNEVLDQITAVAKSAAQTETRLKEMQEAQQELEAKMARPEYKKGSDVDQKEIDAKNATYKMIKMAGQLNGNMAGAQTMLINDANTTDGERKFLNTFNNPDGGFFIAPEFDKEVLKKITETSDVRSVAKVKTIGGGILNITTREKLLPATWVGEAQQYGQGNSLYGRREMKAHKLTASVLVTNEELEDSWLNMPAEIVSDMAEAFALAEGIAFVRGGIPGTLTAANQPQGFLNAPYLNTINTGVVNSFSSDDLIKLTGQLKKGYNGVFAFNRQTLAYILSMKDGVGGYLWHEGADRGFTAGAPPTIAGHRFVIFPDMDNYNTVNGTPIVFADFYRGYLIADRLGSTLLVDPYTQGEVGMVWYRNRRRLDAQVVMPEAFVVLKNQ